MKIKVTKLVALSASIALLPTHSLAQTGSGVTITSPGQITRLFSEWGPNQLIVNLNVPFLNPAGCAATDGYETDPADPVSTLSQSMLLTAYMAHAQLTLAIQGCTPNGRPHIIGIATVKRDCATGQLRRHQCCHRCLRILRLRRCVGHMIGGNPVQQCTRHAVSAGLVDLEIDSPWEIRGFNGCHLCSDRPVISHGGHGKSDRDAPRQQRARDTPSIAHIALAHSA